jgi:hypothetical protein
LPPLLNLWCVAPHDLWTLSTLTFGSVIGHSVVCGRCKHNYLRYYPDLSILREICQIDGRAAYVRVNTACQLPVTDPPARVYLHAWHVTGNEFFRTIAEEILDYVIRETTDRMGEFCSTQDADSEGNEDKFFDGSFYDTSDAGETLITRPRGLQDKPSYRVFR